MLLGFHPPQCHRREKFCCYDGCTKCINFPIGTGHTINRRRETNCKVKGVANLNLTTQIKFHKGTVNLGCSDKNGILHY
uniref:Uncharacterized protein n=1 Tax=Zea mays TaxID=4577 RepID=C0PK40_MAIZE|nr:unknown [Zea mays]